MPEKSLGYNSESAWSKGADSIDIAPEVLVKLLSPGYHANQLKDVEEIVISELPLISSPTILKVREAGEARSLRRTGLARLESAGQTWAI